MSPKHEEIQSMPLQCPFIAQLVTGRENFLPGEPGQKGSLCFLQTIQRGPRSGLITKRISQLSFFKRGFKKTCMTQVTSAKV